MMPTPSAEDRLARFLRGAVVVVAAALVLLVPRFSTRASFLGVSGAPDPVVTLLVGLALWTMPILVAASWAAAGRVRLAHPWLLLPVGLFVAGAVVSTASASDKAAAVVRAAEMTGAWAAFFALLQVLRTGADRRFLLGAVVATAAVSAGLALAQETQDRPFVLAAVMLLALPVAVALAVEKWRRLPPSPDGLRRAGRTRGARGLAVVLVVSALGLAAALVVRHGAWLRAEEPAAWRGAAAMFLDRGLAGVGLENFEWHYAAYEPLAFGGAPVRAGNVWLAVGSEMGLAGLAAAAALVVLVVRAWCRRSAVPYAEGAGASLLVRLGPVVVLAAPAFIVFFPLGVRIGAGVLAGAGVLVALASADSPSRMRLADRPLGLVRWGCIAGVVAWWLYGQAAPVFFSASAAWPMLVVLAVSLERRDEGDSPSAAGPVVEGISHYRAGVRLGPRLQFLVVIAVMGGCFGYVRWLLLPTIHEQAWLDASVGSETVLERAEALREAGRASPLAWEPAWLEGRLWQAEAEQEEPPGAPGLLATEKAVRAYREAIARHPRLREAYLALAACRLAVPGALEDRSALQAARANLERAASLAPHDAATRLRLADVVDRLGDDAAVLEAYRRALELDARAPEGARRLNEDERRTVERRIAELEELVESPDTAP
ncbi:MAG TPA: hypothetical protein VMY35_10385 [Phycisphaerae bacterium]|nr:hypothetical protein [Phycisphaerae bacterium]